MKRFILVAGVDYSGMFKGRGVDFRLLCNNRMKRVLLKNKKKEEMTFQIFDFRKGEVVTHEFTYPKGIRKEKVTKLNPSPFKSITKTSYDRVSSGGVTSSYFKDGQFDRMSILDIYRAVQRIGANTPNTLTELSFFSHAFMGGPILVNSFDDGYGIAILPGSSPTPVRLSTRARDPDDLDPRVNKDFVSPSMLATNIADFRNAFHADGYIWIWGCAFPRIVHEILYKIERNRAYKSSGLGDDELFTFKNFNTSQAMELENQMKHFLGGPFPDKKNIQIKFKFLKLYFCLATLASYSHVIAKHAGVKVYGGVMGTWADYDKKGRFRLMSVFRNSTFRKHLNFYKNYLGFDFDPEGRGYGVYKPGFTCTIPTP